MSPFYCSADMWQVLCIIELLLKIQNVKPQALPPRPHLFKVLCKTKGGVTPILLCLALDNNEGREDKGRRRSQLPSNPTAAGARGPPRPKAGEAHRSEQAAQGPSRRNTELLQAPACRSSPSSPR